LTFWPRIHDITTDTADPPQFVELLARRGNRVSPPGYDGPNAAEEQRRAYPYVQPRVLAVSATKAFDAALAAARRMGWEIVASDRAAGRIEAIATTRMLRFKDDVVVRVRGEAGGARVDVRSKSRVGIGDLGTNARRIREFLGLVHP
jgi:uncharacterized protein (DUF1499 family)